MWAFAGRGPKALALFNDQKTRARRHTPDAYAFLSKGGVVTT